jgi:uncharacterized protein (TIGR03437 family)
MINKVAVCTRRSSHPIPILLAACLTAPAWCQVPSYAISTIAGNGTAGYSGDGGAATSAELDNPRGIVTDPAGNVYFCDFTNNRVRKIATNGTITTVAGTGIGGYNGDNIQGTAAQLNQPYRVALDPAGNLYIADPGNNRIRKLAPNGIITTVAGNGSANYSGDGGPATSAALDYAEDAVVDVFGNIFIADSANNVIRKVSTSGIITTVAGNGYAAGTGNGNYTGDGGLATHATLYNPVSIAVDPAGDIFISDQLNNVIREVNTSGIINTVAGTGTFAFGGDGGPAIKAEFGYPAGVALDAAGNLYIVDVNNDRLRVMLTNGNIATVAGNGNAGFGGDGGPATSAELNAPRSVAVGTFGDVYIADFSNNRVRQLTPSSPTVGQTTNAASNIQVAAANAWISIKGTNLAPAGDTRTWQSSDFVNNLMPTSLDGVSVIMNGLNAYVYYISPVQVNVLAPPGIETGVVQIQVNNNGTKSAPANVEFQAYSPSFFVFNGGPYVAAVHANGTIVGPATLFPGASTPAQPGESIMLYANGFGPTSTPVVAGSPAQSGSLPTMPVITVGGIPATVQFAGLISPGLYQFNIAVPASATNGDNIIVATYSGFATQSGALLTVQ